ncbi:MAG: hypothetical protein AAGG47_22035, partial [Pseudomonadota bacterium]
NPRYAVAVIVEHGGGGSKAAAPIARDVLMHAHYGPEPPRSAYAPGQAPERPVLPPAPRPDGPPENWRPADDAAEPAASGIRT